MQTKHLTSKWKTIKVRTTRARAGSRRTVYQEKKNMKWTGRALQLKRLARKWTCDEVRNDPEGLACCRDCSAVKKWQRLLRHV